MGSGGRGAPLHRLAVPFGVGLQEECGFRLVQWDGVYLEEPGMLLCPWAGGILES